MFKKPFTIFFSSLLILGCDSEESNSTSLTDDVSTGIDNTPPIPTITGLEVDIEVATTINISIQESSEIKEISVLINQDEILNTKEKTFSFELNPFDYPNGENTLSIVAEDSHGNKSKKSQTFEVNKLLASIAAPSSIGDYRVFITANKMTGELITITEVFRDFEIVDLYADDDFTEEPVILTTYIMFNENNYLLSSIKSIANIQPGTDLVKLQDNARFRTENTFHSSQNYDYFSVNVQDIESERIASSIDGGNIIGLSDFLEISISNVTETDTGFVSTLQGRTSSNSNFEEVFLHTTNTTLDLSFERIKMNDYKFFMLEQPFEQNVSFSQFRSPDKIGSIQLPINPERLFIWVDGFKDESAFHNQSFSSLYTAVLDDIENATVKIPLIDDFGLIISNISFPLNGYGRMSASFVGEKNIEVPNWSAQRNQETIILNGDFDIFSLRTSKNLPNADRIVQWEFFHKKQDEIRLNIASFEFPDIIKSLATQSQFDIESIINPDSENVTLIGSSGDLKYEELLFGSQNGIHRPYNADPVDIYSLTTTLFAADVP